MTQLEGAAWANASGALNLLAMGVSATARGWWLALLLLVGGAARSAPVSALITAQASKTACGTQSQVAASRANFLALIKVIAPLILSRMHGGRKGTGMPFFFGAGSLVVAQAMLVATRI